MKKEYTVEQVSESSWFYTFTDTNEPGEKVTIAVSKREDCSFKNHTTKLWKQKGYTDRGLEAYWSIETYVKDTEGYSFGRYNPQHKLREDGKGMVINFDWIFGATCC